MSDNLRHTSTFNVSEISKSDNSPYTSKSNLEDNLPRISTLIVSEIADSDNLHQTSISDISEISESDISPLTSTSNDSDKPESNDHSSENQVKA